MKLLLAFIISILSLTFIAVPAYAYEPPTQGSDNATDVILWPGSSANITISGYEEAVDTVLDEIIMVVLILAITAFGYWHRDRILLGVAGFAWIIYGFAFWNRSWWMSVILVIAGGYIITKSMMDRRKT